MEGGSVTQARAVGHVGDREILTVNAALGSRDVPSEGQWAERPTCPRPTSARSRMSRFPGAESIMDRIDVRLADARNPMRPARAAVGGRPLRAVGPAARRARDVGGHASPSSATTCRSASVRPSAPRPGATASTTPCAWPQLVPSEWVLLDIRVHAVHHGFGHGVVHLWADDGTLLATASQSTIVRFWDGELGTPEVAKN